MLLPMCVRKSYRVGKWKNEDVQVQRVLNEVILIRSDQEMLLQVDSLSSSIDEEVAVDGSCRFPGHLDEYLIPVAASGSLLGGRKCELEGECHHTRVLVRHTLVAAAAAAAAE